ncbi:dehydrogenase [Desulfuromonas versatilis]|uniref:Dehydrogenase n=1 Tax=Desulfuromonas versatilis TaxID=2802975 RepID=A0ABM8HZ39_9BACT|nr:XdhC family protein [Desulfuromonas versatilis]BCR05872.1 dehydrogenase [Desulfuromonas versatilis]
MDDLHIYEEIIRLHKARRSAALATLVEGSDAPQRRVGAKMLVRDDGSTLGTLGGGPLESEVIDIAAQVIREETPRSVPFELAAPKGGPGLGRLLVFIEPATLPPHLFIIGAGGVGRAVAGGARSAGFAVTSIEPPAEAPGYEVDGNASRSLEDQPRALLEDFPVDRRGYILIACGDPQLDFPVAREALQTEACYIGLLGSKRQRMALERYLAKEGVASESFARIISPVGLEIGAETPEEIAVSIVAQLVQHRRLHAAAPAARRETQGQSPPLHG